MCLVGRTVAAADIAHTVAAAVVAAAAVDSSGMMLVVHIPAVAAAAALELAGTRLADMLVPAVAHIHSDTVDAGTHSDLRKAYLDMPTLVVDKPSFLVLWASLAHRPAVVQTAAAAVAAAAADIVVASTCEPTLHLTALPLRTEFGVSLLDKDTVASAYYSLQVSGRASCHHQPAAAQACNVHLAQGVALLLVLQPTVEGKVSAWRAAPGILACLASVGNTVAYLAFAVFAAQAFVVVGAVEEACYHCTAFHWAQWCRGIHQQNSLAEAPCQQERACLAHQWSSVGQVLEV